MLFLPPTLLQPAQAPARPLHAVLEALESLPEAMTDHRPGKVAAEARSAIKTWERAQGALRPHLPSADQARLDTALASLRTRDPHLAAVSALDAQDLLLQLVPAGRDHELRRADQDGMRAWLMVDAAQWDAVPDLEAAFTWLLGHDGGRHPQAVAEVKAELARFHGARQHRETAPALHSVQRLLDLVDVLEKR